MIGWLFCTSCVLVLLQLFGAIRSILSYLYKSFMQQHDRESRGGYIRQTGVNELTIECS